MDVSIVIVTYSRSEVLVDTISYLLAATDFDKAYHEIIIVDQTSSHPKEVDERLRHWHKNDDIRWQRLDQPHLTKAMNVGLIEARANLVLYLDDDIVPGDNLITAHIETHQSERQPQVVIGQVLQPGQTPRDIEYRPKQGILKAYMDFPFYSNRASLIENAMAGNMSVNRQVALAVGGFDEAFIPPVAARFETDFAKRLIKQGHKIWFEPKASIRHLAVSTGGTRALGSHLNSAKGYFGFGDYYFAMRHSSGFELWAYCLKRFFREVRTKYHLRRPWFIPVKWLGEIRAIRQAARAARRPAKLLDQR